MKTFLAVVGGIVLACVLAAAAYMAWVYFTICGGHPHGLC